MVKKKEQKKNCVESDTDIVILLECLITQGKQYVTPIGNINPDQESNSCCPY